MNFCTIESIMISPLGTIRSRKEGKNSWSFTFFRKRQYWRRCCRPLLTWTAIDLEKNLIVIQVNKHKIVCQVSWNLVHILEGGWGICESKGLHIITCSPISPINLSSPILDCWCCSVKVVLKNPKKKKSRSYSLHYKENLQQQELGNKKSVKPRTLCKYVLFRYNKWNSRERYRRSSASNFDKKTDSTEEK